MCNSLAEGGQRCPTHTGKTLRHRAAVLREAAESGDMARFLPAQQKWEEAAIAYASTTEGADMLTEQARTSAREGDLSTEAMLNTIVQRGQDMRAANEHTRALLRAARITETITPTTAENAITARDVPFASAEHEEILANFVAALDAGREEALNRAAGSSKEWAMHYTGRAQIARHYAVAFRNANTVLGDATSEDEQIAQALQRTCADRPLSEGYKEARRVTASHALQHPNAGVRTHSLLLSYDRVLPVADVLAAGKCPDEALARACVTFRGDDDSFVPNADMDAVWAEVNRRRKQSAALTIQAACYAPDEADRQDATLDVAGLNWAELSARDFGEAAASLRGLHASWSTKQTIAASMLRHLHSTEPETGYTNVKYHLTGILEYREDGAELVGAGRGRNRR